MNSIKIQKAKDLSLLMRIGKPKSVKFSNKSKKRRIILPKEIKQRNNQKKISKKTNRQQLKINSTKEIQTISIYIVQMFTNKINKKMKNTLKVKQDKRIKLMMKNFKTDIQKTEIKGKLNKEQNSTTNSKIFLKIKLKMIILIGLKMQSQFNNQMKLSQKFRDCKKKNNLKETKIEIPAKR